MSLPEPFPGIDVAEDHDPGIRLFGKRFITEQTSLEYISEFLSVVFSAKRIGLGAKFSTALPPMDHLKAWAASSEHLSYKPSIRLNLKLFSFLPCSRLESRHPVHRKHYDALVDRLKNQIESGGAEPAEVVEWIGELFRSLQGAGFNRTWCAQTFWPLTPGLVTQETIWNETVVRKDPVDDWMESIDGLHKYYSVSKHRFLARGGEVLYLQICNALTVDKKLVGELAASMGTGTLSSDEADPGALHQCLEQGLSRLDAPRDSSFEQLVDYVDSLDGLTVDALADRTNPLECQWCPREGWREGYLYAVEMSRLLDAHLDSMERINLLMTGAALHVLRSLCTQSARYARNSFPRPATNGLGYAWVVTPQGPYQEHLMLSRHSLQAIQKMVFRALRDEGLQENARRDEPQKSAQSLYREADRRYGHKLFMSLAKRIVLVAPSRGPGPRFVMTDMTLRYMVLTLLRSGERCTYAVFLERLYRHYGIAVEGSQLEDATAWAGLPANTHFQSQRTSWLSRMLRAGGFLVELSDACAIVRNNF